MQRLQPGTDDRRLPACREAAVGGMASLWRATHPDFELPLVLKIPFLDPGQDVSVIIGFEVEEMILKRLSGPHVPRFAGSGDLTRIPYIAMEFVAGAAWRTGRGCAARPSGCRPHRRRHSNCAAALHRQKVAHLDLKPENVILAPRGAVLLDFGLASHSELPDLLGEESTCSKGSLPAWRLSRCSASAATRRATFSRWAASSTSSRPATSRSAARHDHRHEPAALPCPDRAARCEPEGPTLAGGDDPKCMEVDRAAAMPTLARCCSTSIIPSRCRWNCRRSRSPAGCSAWRDVPQA